MELNNTVSVVTGGGTGIGLGIALALAEAGSRVVICGRRQEKLEEACKQRIAAMEGAERPMETTAKEATAGIAQEAAGRHAQTSEREEAGMAANGRHAEKAGTAREAGTPETHGRPLVPYRLDIADRRMVNAVFENITKEYGRIDILVNAAGINIPHRTMKEMPPEDWDRVVEINLTGTYNCVYAVLPQMREAKAGFIINIVSIAGFRAAVASGIAYIASKYGMTGFGMALASEESDNNIRVTNVYPGEVDTPIIDQRPNPDPPERRAAMLQPADFGALIVSLAGLPDRVHIPEVVVKPVWQKYS